MKKYLFSLIALVIVACVPAQTTPRYGYTKNSDNTGRVLTYALVTTTDVTSATIDTILFAPNAWETIWRPSANLADSCVIKFSSTATSNYKVGDTFTAFLTKGTGNGRVRFGGSVYVSSTVNSTGIAIAATKQAVIKLRWNGTKWFEEYHTVQP